MENWGAVDTEASYCCNKSNSNQYYIKPPGQQQQITLVAVTGYDIYVNGT
jgi:hypothetical protein